MPTSSPSPEPSGTPSLSLDEVRVLARLLHETDLSEIEIETVAPGNSEAPSAPPVRLQLRRGTEPTVVRRAPAATAPRAGRAASTNAGAATTPATSAGTVAVGAEDPAGSELLSPGVGIFRAAKPAVQLGDIVKVGQKAGAVEALKIPSDIVFAVAGRVSTILVEDGNGIEYAQPLFVIEPQD